jgi:acyl-CoA synthetase (AMP-forming)/AMP-acid ligase II
MRSRPPSWNSWSASTTADRSAVPHVGVAQAGDLAEWTSSTARNLGRNAVHMGHRPDDVLLPLLPFSHQYGLSMVLIAWLVRCSPVIAPYRRLDRGLRMAGQTGATVLDATPAMYRTIHDLIRGRPAGTADLSTVRLFCSGAAPLGSATARAPATVAGYPVADSSGVISRTAPAWRAPARCPAGVRAGRAAPSRIRSADKRFATVLPAQRDNPGCCTAGAGPGPVPLPGPHPADQGAGRSALTRGDHRMAPPLKTCGSSVCVRA